MVSAPVQPIGAPFVPASADQPLDVGLHQQLQDALGHSTQKTPEIQKLHGAVRGRCRDSKQESPQSRAAWRTDGAQSPRRYVYSSIVASKARRVRIVFCPRRN